MKNFILTLTLLLSFSLVFAPAHAEVLRDVCRDCETRRVQGFEPCPREIEELCELLEDNPGTIPRTSPPGGTPGPGGPCCRSCYCFRQDGVLYSIPLGDPGLGGQ